MATRTKTTSEPVEAQLASPEEVQTQATNSTVDAAVDAWELQGERSETRTAKKIEKWTAGLLKEFPKDAIKTRKGGGGKDLSYVEGQTVIRRLIEVWGNEWDFEIVGDPIFRDHGKSARGDVQTLVIVHGRLTHHFLGARDGLGVQITTVAGGEDLVKGAETDALKKAATKFGVALHLYGADYENPPVTVTTKRGFADAYKIAKGTSPTAKQANEIANEAYGRNFEDLSDAEAQALISVLQQQEPSPVKTTAF